MCNDEGNEAYSEEDYINAVHSIAEEIGDKKLEGWVYISLGCGYNSRGDFRKAVEFYQRGLAIAKTVGDKELQQAAYWNLGTTYYSNYDFPKAIDFLQETVRIAKEIGNKKSEGTGCINLGCVYRKRGDIRKAIKFQQQGLVIAKEVGDKESEGTAYGNLGSACIRLYDFPKAFDFIQKKLSIAKEIGSKVLEGSAYEKLGRLYYDLGDPKKAVEFGQQSLRIYQKCGQRADEGRMYLNLASVYLILRKLEMAAEFSQKGLKISKEIENKNLEGGAYASFADLYVHLGDLKASFEFGQKALRIAKETGDKELEGRMYFSLGLVYCAWENFEKANEFLEQALSKAKEIGLKLLEGWANVELSVVVISLSNFARAEELLKCSMKVFEETRVLLKNSKDEWKINFQDKNVPKCNLWCHLLLQGKTTEALFTVERGRAQALRDLMESNYGVKLAQSSSEDLIERISRFSSHTSSSTVFLAEHYRTLNFWVLLKGQQCQFVPKEINQTLTSLKNETYKQIGVRGFRCEERFLDDPLDEEKKGLPDRACTEGKESTSSQEDLKALSDVVIAPISHLIKGDELIIVPDGPSFLIPYAALVDQHSRFLSETLRIRIVPSLNILMLLAECPEKYHSSSGALLVGNPWVETVRLKGCRPFPQLPGAEEEVKMIGQILNTEPLTGKKASKDQVLSRLNSVCLVHIAAHGRAETGEIILSPNLPGPQRPKEEDFLLTRADVLNTKLRAKLVVLSCCNSGRGEIKWEGVVGIARAFLGAGARSVIASLWSIDDKATLAFMKVFYEHLAAGQSASMSLHQAMKWMQKSKLFKAVKHWAPFMLIGDDVTLTLGQQR